MSNTGFCQHPEQGAKQFRWRVHLIGCGIHTSNPAGQAWLMIQDVHQDSGLILQILEQQRVGIDFILVGLFLDEVRHQRQLGTYTAGLNLLKII